MAAKMATTYRFVLVDIRLVIYHLISSIFNISITLSPKFEYGLCLMNDNHNGCQNGHRLWSVSTCAHSNLDIYSQLSSKWHICITFIKLFPKIRCGYFPMNDNQDGRLNSHRLLVCMCGHSNLVVHRTIFS